MKQAETGKSDREPEAKKDLDELKRRHDELDEEAGRLRAALMADRATAETEAGISALSNGSPSDWTLSVRPRRLRFCGVSFSA